MLKNVTNEDYLEGLVSRLIITQLSDFKLWAKDLSKQGCFLKRK